MQTLDRVEPVTPAELRWAGRVSACLWFLTAALLITLVAWSSTATAVI